MNEYALFIYYVNAVFIKETEHIELRIISIMETDNYTCLITGCLNLNGI